MAYRLTISATKPGSASRTMVEREAGKVVLRVRHTQSVGKHGLVWFSKLNQ
jgi:hypothetical protein